MSDNINKIKKVLKIQGKEIAKVQQATELAGNGNLAEVGLSNESIREVRKLIQTELVKGVKPISDSLKQLDRQITSSNKETMKTVEKSLENIKDQIDDLSSKTELQMLEIVESLNQSPSKTSATKTKRKLTS